MIDIRSKIKQSILPHTCILCGASARSRMLCPGCESDLPWLSLRQCPVCALPTGTGNTCGNCLKSPPAFDATHALLEYNFPVNAVLQRYKYSGFLAVADLMAELFAERYDSPALPDLILPMPLHPDRLQERGFNQAVEIGRILAKRAQIPMDTRRVKRTRQTAPQAGLNLRQRRSNLRNAFSCEGRLDGLRIALLDDVMTTGASLNALAETVKNAGAAHVECWVMARTLPDTL